MCKMLEIRCQGGSASWPGGPTTSEIMNVEQRDRYYYRKVLLVLRIDLISPLHRSPASAIRSGIRCTASCYPSAQTVASPTPNSAASAAIVLPLASRDR